MSGVDFTALDPMIVPCASKITLHDGSVVGGDESCVWDKQEVQNYMASAFSLLSFVNQQEFMADKFGDESVL